MASAASALPLAAPAPSRAAALEREWCTGGSPASWGFAVTPPVGATAVRLRVETAGLTMTQASAGPSVPDGWTVRRESDTLAIASGPSPLAPGVAVPELFLVQTNRSTGDVTSRGVLPVTWSVTLVDGAGKEEPPITASFPPVMQLDEAVARGLVLATAEPLTPAGPVEITVDNPTWQPLCLDLPPGTVLKAGSAEWVVGLVRPFDMMRRQKTGRTLTVFPLRPPGASRKAPQHLALCGKRHEMAGDIAELALAVQRLQKKRSDPGERRATFAGTQPFDFWPLVLEWSVWKETGSATREVLVSLVTSLLEERRAQGDWHATDVEPGAAADEVEAALADLAAIRETVHAEPLPVDAQACRARFN